MSANTTPTMVSAPATSYSIQTRGLNLWYGDFQALRDIDVNIRSACITSLIGPSGCGKTTLLRCFNRINERYGNVTHDRRDHDPRQEHLRRQCLARRAAQGGRHGVSAAQPAADFDLRQRAVWHAGTRAEQAIAPVGARRDRRSVRLDEVFLWQDVKDKLRKKATVLTLEQQQKLCIARLLPLKPRVILMDEPCSALDAAGTERIESLILGLRDDSRS